MDFPQKLKTELPTIWSSNSTPGYVSKGEEARTSQAYLPFVFTEALFTMAKIWKQFQGLSIDKGIKEKWDTQTQWSIFQPLTRWKSFLLRHHRWTWRTLCQVKQDRQQTQWAGAHWPVGSNRLRTRRVVVRGWEREGGWKWGGAGHGVKVSGMQTRKFWRPDVQRCD